MGKRSEESKGPRDKSSPDQRIVEVLDKCKDVPWLCTSCNFLLGWVDRETKSEIRVKFKDQWVQVEGKLLHICRRCGKLNELIDEDFSLFLLNKKEFLHWLVKQHEKNKLNKGG